MYKIGLWFVVRAKNQDDVNFVFFSTRYCEFVLWSCYEQLKASTQLVFNSLRYQTLMGVLHAPLNLYFIYLFLKGLKTCDTCQILTTEVPCLPRWIFWVTKYPFWCVCAKTPCPSWELKPGPSTFRADALPTDLSGQLRIQCPWCP